MDFSKANNNLLYANYNEEEDCVIFGTKTGFYVYTLYPQKKIISCKINGGVSKISMLHRSNIFFFVGNVNSGEYSKKILNIWDDSHKKVVGQINFKDDICHMNMYSDTICISTKNDIYIYNFDNLKLIDSISISNNLSGIFKVILDSQCIIYPDNNTINIYNWETKETRTIDSHIDNIQLFSISKDNTLLATCSYKGSIIRIFNITTLTLVKELRRGIDYVTIVNLAFNKDNTLLLCSSSKGTIHVFSLDVTNNMVNAIENINNTTDIIYTIPDSDTSVSNISKLDTLISHTPIIKNRKMYGAHYFKSILPKYFNSEWSCIQIYLKNVLTHNVFSKDTNSIITVASNGCFYSIEFSYDLQTFSASHKIISTLKFLSDHNDPFDHRNSTIL